MMFHSLNGFNLSLLLSLTAITLSSACGDVPTEDVPAEEAPGESEHADMEILLSNRIAVGSTFSCWIDDEKNIECWGRGFSEEEEDESGSSSTEGNQAPLGSYRQISIGDDYGCALGIDEAVKCWGKNDFGQATAPTGSFLQVTTHTFHTCAIKSDQLVQCCGLSP